MWDTRYYYTHDELRHLLSTSVGFGQSGLKTMKIKVPNLRVDVNLTLHSTDFKVYHFKIYCYKRLEKHEIHLQPTI